MDTHDDIVHLDDGSPQTLDVASLERDLVALWAEESGGKSGLVRACHSTLVVHAGAGGDHHELLDDITRLHPSRVIRVVPNPEKSQGQVDAWVTATCSRRPGEGSMVCAEIVQLEAGPQTGHLVASAIRSLSVAGVPVVVLSEEPSPLELGWVDGLQRVADMVLGNSLYLTAGAGHALWERALASEAKPWYRDMQWVHLRDWRRAIATWFDHPTEADSWNLIESVTVEVSELPGAELKAWLLIGWLGSRLGWTVPRASTAPGSPVIHGPRGPVAVHVRRARLVDDPAVALSVALEFKGRPPVCWRRLSRERALVVERGKNGERLARLNQTKTSRASAVVRVIHQHEPDPVAQDAMRFALGATGGAS